MLVNATFIGKTSLGFITNNTYDLKLNEAFIGGDKVHLDISLSAEMINNKSRCHYGKVDLFLQNWKVNSFIDNLQGWSDVGYSIAKEIILSEMRDQKLNCIFA